MNPNEILAKARALLRSGIMAGELAKRHGELQDPIPVEHPRGEVHSWFVPVRSNDSLLGFFELSPSGMPLRYSSFQRRPDSVEGCPAVAAWLDPSEIQRKARTILRKGETVGEPFLSYDAAPSRLAWAVPVTSETGERNVYVAGDSAFEGKAGGEFMGG